MSDRSQAVKGFEMGAVAEARPEFITDDHLEFLDGLREEGITNMFGARPYVMEEFPELGVERAATVLSYWMKTFGKLGR